MYGAKSYHSLFYAERHACGNIASNLMTDDHRKLFLLTGEETLIGVYEPSTVQLRDGRLHDLTPGDYLQPDNGIFVRVQEFKCV